MADGKIKAPVLDASDGFTANGVYYLVEMPETLGILRKLEWTKEVVRITTGHDENALLGRLVAMGKDFDKQHMTKVAVHIETMKQQVGEINNRRDPVMWACALFINEKDEDRTVVPSDHERQRKIDNWAAAGVPYFFLQGFAERFSDTVRKLSEAYTPTKRSKRNATPTASPTNSSSSKSTSKSSS